MRIIFNARAALINNGAGIRHRCACFHADADLARQGDGVEWRALPACIQGLKYYRTNFLDDGLDRVTLGSEPAIQLAPA